MKILIVDDNADNRRLLKYIVERKDHEAVEAGDGLEGLRMAKLHRPDLIISDALMPVMDGFQFLRHIKEDETLRSIPFIFYSATYRADKDVDLALALGAEAYIIKPKEPAELWEEVEFILEEAKKEKVITPELIKEDEEYLKRYREVVTTTLEEKIRELEATKARLEESEAFVRNILESVDEGFIVIDRNYRILSANKAFCWGSKMPRENILGKYCYACSHYADKPCFEAGEKCAVRETFDTGLPARAVHVHYDKEGKPSYYEVKSYPMKDISGNVVSAIEVTIDITEKTKLEEQLQHAQKMEAIGQLAGGVAHDFNNILSAIIGYASLTLLKMGDDDPLKTNIDQILNASQRATTLTQSLLAFSRKQVVNLAGIDLNELMKRFEKFLLRILREDVELMINCPGEALPVMADSGQIEQLLMNLAANASDAMPDGGLLTIETETINLSEEFIETHGYGKPGNFALITVSDTGTGMDEKTKEKIFDPFFTTKEEGKGTGLGLSMVYGIVKQHDGFINVYSEPGHGTTFRIYLPIAGTAATAEEIAEAEPVAVRGGTETVLIAEDDSALRKLTSTVLKHYGYTVIESVDGEDAISKFIENKDRIQLVILDGIMPKKNGKEAYDEIQSIKPDIRTIFLSGYSEDVFSAKSMMEKGLTYILKPVTPSDLVRKVREVLDKGSE